MNQQVAVPSWDLAARSKLAAHVPALAFLGVSLSWGIVFFPPFLAVGVACVCFAAAMWLIFPEVATYTLVSLCPFALTYEVGGLEGVRIHDALLVALGISSVTSLLAGSHRVRRFSTPMGRILFGVWLFLLVWGSVTFLLGPVNQWFLKGPIHNTWYLYRGVWRLLLPFPLLLLCIDDRRAARRVIDLTLIVATGVALDAIWLVWQTGWVARGPYRAQNELASLMILSLPFMVSRLLLEAGWLRRLLHGVGLLILFRALWLTGSRGGLVAFLASLLPMSLLVPRRRLVAFGTVGIVLLSLVVVAKGDVLDRPFVQRFLTLGQGSEMQTFKWRQEQWAFFLQHVYERPWLGRGSEVDESLKEMGRLTTPHNGYLGLAVSAGIPAVVAWVTLLGALLLGATWCAMSPNRTAERAFWIGLMGCLVALAAHNTVDSSFQALPSEQFFWTLAALALVYSAPERGPADVPGHAALLVPCR